MALWSAFTGFFGFGNGGDTVRVGTQYQKAPPSDSDVAVRFDTAMSVSAFWASSRLLSEAVAGMPIKCFSISPDNFIKEPNNSYELWKLLNYKPNRRQTRTEFFEQIMLNLVVHGNSFVVIDKTTRGKIISLTPIPADQVEVILMDGGDLVYQYSSIDSEIKVFSESSMWHIKLFGNGVIGLSPLKYAAKALGISLDLEKRVSKLAKNGGRTSGVLTFDQQLKPDQREAFRQSFQGMVEGDSEELFVLEAGMAYNQLSLSPSDMQALENRRFSLEDVARFMGVPSVLINDTAGSTVWGSGIGQIMEGFYKLNLRPYLERIESSLKRKLIPESDWETIEIEFDFNALLRADAKTRIETQTKAVNAGILTPNEARAREGLPPQEGGEVIYLNGSLMPANQERTSTTTAESTATQQQNATGADTNE